MSDYNCTQCKKMVRSKGLPARWIRAYSRGSGSSERKYICGNCVKKLTIEQERNLKVVETKAMGAGYNDV